MCSGINQVASLLSLCILPDWLKNVFSWWHQMWHWPHPWDIYHRLETKTDSKFSSLCNALWPHMRTSSCLEYRSQLRLRRHSIPSWLEKLELVKVVVELDIQNSIERSWSTLSALFFQGKKSLADSGILGEPITQATNTSTIQWLSNLQPHFK